MKKLLSITLLIFSVILVNSSPRINFNDLLSNAEQNPAAVTEARNLAMNKGLPVTIYTIDRIIMDAKAVEDGKIVYAVFTDLLDVYNGGYAAYYEEIAFKFDASTSRMDFGRGHIVDNTHGMYDPVISSGLLVSQFIMITDATNDGVYLFNAQNGDLLETNFILPSNPQLQTPKEALQHFSSRFILVADQISDLVQKFDTNGTYISHFAPSGGVNTSIIDNIRSVTYRPNRNILVTVGSSANQNTVQQFDTGGVHIGTFIPTGNINSPFDVIIRTSDLLVSNFSGTNRITRCDLNGTFLNQFYTGSNFAAPEQIFEMPNGFIAAAAFSSPSGIAVLNPTGNFVKLITTVTGNRGIYLLGNGHYLTTNGSGVHEIDSATGSLIRTVTTATGFQYISEYTPGAILSNGNNHNTLPEGFSLAQNYPNPFNPSTVIMYSLPSASEIRLSVFDVTGREVIVLFNGKQEAGEHEVTFDAKGFASGIYYYKLEANGYSDVKKMALIK